MSSQVVSAIWWRASQSGGRDLIKSKASESSALADGNNNNKTTARFYCRWFFTARKRFIVLLPGGVIVPPWWLPRWKVICQGTTSSRWHAMTLHKVFSTQKMASKGRACVRESKKTPLSLGVVPHESRVRRNFTDLSARFAFGFSATHQAPRGTAYYSLLQTVEMRLTLVLCTLCFALKSPPQRRCPCIRSVYL